MALPFSFSSELKWSDHLNMAHGPFQNGSNLYAVLLDKTANSLEVWKSTDSGNSWAEQDAANKKAISATATAKSCSVVQDGTTLHIAWIAATATIAVVPFSMATDTYGTVAGGGPAITTSAAGYPFSLVVRSDGDYIVFHNGATQNIMGTPYRRVYYSRYEGAAWTNNTNVGGVDAQFSQNALTASFGSSDRAHFVWMDGGTGLMHRALTSANALQTTQAITTDISLAQLYPVGLPFLNGSEVIFPWLDAAGDLNLARATSADAPSWGITEAATTTNDPEYTNANPAALAVSGTYIYAFWPNDADQDIYYDNDAGSGAWGTDTEWKDAITCGGINARAITGGIGILYDDGGTVKYDFFSVTTTFAPPPRIDPYRVMLVR